MIKQISLQNFRNYSKTEFELGGKNIVVGRNGSGKSNLLEALYMLAIGKSKRAGTEAEMIRYGEQFAFVNYFCDENLNFQVMLSDGTTGSRKRFEVNGIPRRMIDFAGKIRMVEFSPTDMDLIIGSPSVRRRYLDFVLSQVDREYHRCLVSYEKGVRARNKILENIREGLATRSQLFFWDRLLIKNGEYITLARGKYLEKLNRSDMSDGTNRTYTVEYDKSVISEVRLAQYEMEEVAAAATLVGPHRDDFMVLQNDKDVAKYGSRGEQRMAVLWLKLAERDFLIRDNELPVLLFDDIFSELDEKHKEEVLKLVEDQIKRGGQVVMTSADEKVIPKDKTWKVIKL
jgi:DNA replication and repair protein RecF